MTHRKAATIDIPTREPACREPTLDEILSDPIVEAVMQADAVDPKALRALLDKVAQARGVAAPAG